MERYERYFASLVAAVKVINSSLEPAKVLKDVAQQAAMALMAKGCTLRLLDRTGQRLLPSAAWGLSETYFRKGPVDLARSEVDREVLSGRTVHIANAQCDQRFQYGQAAKAEGIVSVLAVPLLVEGRAVGAMRIYSDTERAFDAAELEFARAVADLSALAIENARLHQALKTDYEMLSSFEHRIFED